MGNNENLTTEEVLKNATETLKAAAAELEAATGRLAKVAAEAASPAVKSVESAKAVSEPEKLSVKEAPVPEEQAAEKTEAAQEPIEGETSVEAPAKAVEVTEPEQEETPQEAEPTKEEISEEAKEEPAREKTETAEEAASEETAAVETPKKGGKASNIIFTLIRIVLVVALVAAIVFYVFLRNQESSVPAADVFKAVTQSVDTDKMEQTTDRYFKKYYGLNAADYDDVLYYAPVSNMDAEELLVVKLKDVNQAEAVTDAILKRQADKEQSFEGYAPEQYALAQAYILDVQGNYILFVVDPKAEEIDAAFAGAL